MKIAIIGGGIAGLTLSLALKKFGFEPKIFERAEKLNEVGAGIWIQPNAIKVFDWLGIVDQLIKEGKLLNTVEIVNKNLRPFASEQISNEGTSKLLSIHRSRLQEILFNNIPPELIKLNSPFNKCEHNDKSVEVTAGNHVEKFDVLIGADGINSPVREEVVQNAVKRYSGQTCWRGISDISLPEEFLGNGKECWGNNIRFGFANISDREVYWFAVANAPQDQTDNNDVKQKLLRSYKKFHPIVKSIIENTPEDKIIRNDLLDLKRLPRWSKDRICLVGDAAHATTPNMGQGAGQAIEDAYILSNLLKNSETPQSAFLQFESIRRKKVDYIVNNSWAIGKIAHNTFGRIAFRLLMKVTPQKVMKKQIEKIHNLDTL